MSDTTTITVTARQARKAAQMLLALSLNDTKGRPGLTPEDKSARLTSAAGRAMAAGVLLSGAATGSVTLPTVYAEESGLVKAEVPDTVPGDWTDTEDQPAPDDFEGQYNAVYGDNEE